MATAQLLQPADSEPGHDAPECASDKAARISFRQPVSTDGFIDAAWWPRSTLVIPRGADGFVGHRS